MVPLLTPIWALSELNPVFAQSGGAAWSPYVVGALIGALSMLTFYFSNKPLGASTAYARVAGMIGLQIAPKHTRSLTYFDEKAPKLGWELMLVIGVIAGSFLAALSGSELTGRWLPEMWQAQFGSESYVLRTVVAFAGGLMMAVGARMAGGCTSGHGISGTLQLAIGSWVAVICFFIGGVVAAMILFA